MPEKLAVIELFTNREIVNYAGLQTFFFRLLRGSRVAMKLKLTVVCLAETI